jgi:DNA-binding NtrC family response regulator
MTAFGSLETAVDTIRAGACDFMTKPFDIEALVIAIERALGQRNLRVEVKRLQHIVADTQRFDEILGSSSAMRTLYDRVSRLAESEASAVLVTGESGTGKELVARHRLRRRLHSGHLCRHYGPVHRILRRTFSPSSDCGRSTSRSRG